MKLDIFLLLKRVISRVISTNCMLICRVISACWRMMNIIIARCFVTDWYGSPSLLPVNRGVSELTKCPHFTRPTNPRHQHIIHHQLIVDSTEQ